jgi:ribosome-associated toxin RatA of RatAB toxin-antitoxin module
MAAHRETQSVEVEAPAEAVFAALTDFESLPDWQRALKRCVVLSRHPDGTGHEVEYILDAKFREVRYVLAHDYDAPHRIGSSYLEGDFKDMEGTWTMRPAGDTTHVSLDLEIDPGLPVPGPLKRQLRNRILGRALDDLANHLARP